MVSIQGGTNAGDAHSVCAEQLHQHRPVHWIDPSALLEKSRSFCRTSWLYPRCPINGSGNVFCPAWRDRSDDFGNRSRCSSCSGPPRGNGNGDFNCGGCNWHFYTWDWDSRMAGVPLSGCSDRSRSPKHRARRDRPRPADPPSGVWWPLHRHRRLPNACVCRLSMR